MDSQKTQIKSIDVGDLIILNKNKHQTFGYVLRKWEDEDDKNVNWLSVSWKSLDESMVGVYVFSEYEVLKEYQDGYWTIQKGKRS